MWQILKVIPASVILIYAFLLGLVFGSFLNVCIVRIPQGKSVILPASACPQCGTPIKVYDNIPVLSYLFLRGQCRSCRARISPMYPLVEILMGVFCAGSYLAFGLTWEALKWAIFSALIMILFFTDLRERILPDAVNYSGFGLGLALSLLVPVHDGTALWLSRFIFEFPPPERVLSLVDALLGAGIGSGFLFVVSEGYFRLRGREGMGLGDVKMMLMAGAFLGPRRTILTILAGSILGSILGVLFILVRRKTRDYELPFGCFLGAGALLVVWFGSPVVNWYTSLFSAR